MTLDNYQLEYCNSNGQFTRLLAPAGSGKTQSLLWRCLYKFNKAQKSGKTNKFLIFTFTRVAKEELKERLNKNTEFNDIKNHVKIDTLNQWGFNYLKRNVESSIEVKVSKYDKYFLIKNILRPIWKEIPLINSTLQKRQNKYDKIIEIFDSLKSAGFRHDTNNIEEHFYEHLIWLKNNFLERYLVNNIIQPIFDLELADNNHSYLPKQLQSFLQFWQKSCEHLWNTAIISLDDQKYWAMLKLQEKYGNNTFPEPNRYHHILVDEFQDINPLDLHFVKTLVSVNNSSLDLIGDEDQAIYEWRGSTPHFILNPDTFFENEFKNYLLKNNYRSPYNIVEISETLIKNNNYRVNKQIYSHNKDSAKIEHYNFNTHMESLNFVMNLAEKYANQNIPKKIAVIGRKKSQIIPLQILLTSKDIPYFAKEDLNILLSKTFETLKNILYAIATKNDRRLSKDTIDSFISCCDKIDTYPLKRNEKNSLYRYLLSKQPKSFYDAIQYFQTYNGPIKGTKEEKSKTNFLIAILNVFETKTVSESIEAIGNNFKGLQKHFAKSDDDIFYKEPPFLYLSEYAQTYDNDYFEFIEHIEKAISKMDYNPEKEKEGYDDDLNLPIHIMTALRAKGKEYDIVILLDVNDGIWPIMYAETEQEIEQERRIFYVAITRTKKELYFLSVKSILGKSVKISPYLNELDKSKFFNIRGS